MPLAVAGEDLSLELLKSNSTSPLCTYTLDTPQFQLGYSSSPYTTEANLNRNKIKVYFSLLNLKNVL